MGGKLTAREQRLTDLEQRPVRLVWIVCAVVTLPLLIAGLVEHRHGGSTNDVVAVLLWLVAFGATASVVMGLRPLKARPVLAVPLAPLLFVVMLYTIGFLGLVLGIVSP